MPRVPLTNPDFDQLWPFGGAVPDFGSSFCRPMTLKISGFSSTYSIRGTSIAKSANFIVGLDPSTIL